MMLNPLVQLLLLLFLPALVYSHGLMTIPYQRGALSPRCKFNRNATFPLAPADQKAHFPAGDKDSSPGAAARSQIRTAGSRGWTPFAPLRPDFKWRAGVCGDLPGPNQAHMRGGEFYYGAQITATYVEAQEIQIEMNIVANHNGFMELHICDVKKCGGEISEQCFKDGHCQQLLRAPNESCDSGYDLRCAPIDPNYPGRWYLPCARVPENSQERFGNDKMTYQLPKGLTCDHCVLHWFWSAANTCNPPGVINFYEGENGPKNWEQCPGQGGAKGGYTKVQKDCSKDRFPEEYYQCADIRIEKKKGSNGEEDEGEDNGILDKFQEEPVSPTPSVSPTPTLSPSVTPTPSSSIPSPSSSPVPSVTPTKTPSVSPVSTNTPSPAPTKNVDVLEPLQPNVFKRFVLVGDGNIVAELRDGYAVDVSRYEKVAIEVETSEIIDQVVFYLDGEEVWTEKVQPYFLFGNTGRVPNYWNYPILGKWFEIKAVGGGAEMKASIKLVK